MERKASKLIAVVLVFCVLLTMSLAGCGNQTAKETAQTTTGNAQATTAAPTPEPTYEFTVYGYGIPEGGTVDPVITEVEKKLNIKIDSTQFTWDTQEEKYNVLMASGNVPDLSVVLGPGPGLGSGKYDMYAEQGKYLDLTDLVPQYQNIVNNVPKGTFEIVKTKGKLFCIPNPYAYEDAMIFRMDWLKKLGLSIPKTADELYNVFKAFREQDPDGNGKQDTYGYVTDPSMYNMMFIFSLFGIYGDPSSIDYGFWYKKSDGTVEPQIYNPGAKEAVKYIAKLYKEKLLDQEWMVNNGTDVYNKFQTGKGGCFVAPVSYMFSQILPELQKVCPTAEIEASTDFPGPDGKNRRDQFSPYYMCDAISAAAKRPEKILQFLDYLASPEGHKLVRWGVEGVTYKMVDGFPQEIPEATKKYKMEGGHGFSYIMRVPTYGFSETTNEAKYAPMLKWMIDMEPGLPAPVTLIPSLAKVKSVQGPNYIHDTIVKMIVGKLDVDAEWDNMVKKWKETGGDTLIKEINDNYQKFLGK